MRFLPPALTRLAGAAAVAALLSACSFITGVPDVSRVDLSLSSAVIAPGEASQATGLAVGNGGGVVDHPRRRVSYSSANDSIATVNPAGLVRGVAPGRVKIRASAGGKTDEVEITVRPVPVRQLLINRRVLTFRLVPGVAYILDAAAADSNGQLLSNRQPVWTSLDPTVLTVNQIGAVTTLALGTARIRASVDTGLAPKVGTVADTVTVRVTSTPVTTVRVTPTNPTIYRGQTAQFTATVIDSTQTTVTRRVVWRTSPARTVVAIDSTTGLATAVAEGTATVLAVVDRVQGAVVPEEFSGGVTVTVLTPTASVRVSNSAGTVSTLSLRTGASAAVALNALDVLGNTLSGRTFRLTSSNPAVVAVPDVAQPSAYTLTAGATTGSATITVQALDVNGGAQGTPATFTVNVNP